MADPYVGVGDAEDVVERGAEGVIEARGQTVDAGGDLARHVAPAVHGGGDIVEEKDALDGADAGEQGAALGAAGGLYMEIREAGRAVNLVWGEQRFEREMGIETRFP